METNPGLRRPVPAVCRILSSNVRGLATSLSLATNRRLEMKYFCALRLVSDMSHLLELQFPVLVTLSCFARAGCFSPRDGGICTRYFPPVAWGDQNSANVCPCACRKRRLIMGYKLSNTTGLLYAWSSCMQ